MRTKRAPKYTVQITAKLKDTTEAGGPPATNGQLLAAGNGSSQRVAAARAAEALINNKVPTPCAVVFSVWRNR